MTVRNDGRRSDRLRRPPRQRPIAWTTLSRLLNGRAGISAFMALKLEAALNTSAEMGMTMQAHYDLYQARQNPRPV